MSVVKLAVLLYKAIFQAVSLRHLGNICPLCCQEQDVLLEFPQLWKQDDCPLIDTSFV